jgi:hypothetical protein
VFCSFFGLFFSASVRNPDARLTPTCGADRHPGGG